MKKRLAAALFVLAATQAGAHRLDEYLQGTIVSMEKNRVSAQVTMTPGVAVFPFLLAEIDVDQDGGVSAAEQHAYAGRVLRDISLKIDGRPISPHLISAEFPSVEDMKEGRGEIRMQFDADLPAGGTNRKLMFENHHLSQISAYQVNCLAPRDPDIRVITQKRNYSQSIYEVDFTQAGGSPASLLSWTGFGKPVGTAAILLGGWVLLLVRRRHTKASEGNSARPAVDDRSSR